MKRLYVKVTFKIDTYLLIGRWYLSTLYLNNLLSLLLNPHIGLVQMKPCSVQFILKKGIVL
jgi:hypothetical protein